MALDWHNRCSSINHRLEDARGVQAVRLPTLQCRGSAWHTEVGGIVDSETSKGTQDRRFTIRRKLNALFVVTVLSLGADVVGGKYVLDQVRVNGPVYQSIVVGKDLEIDLTPPSQFVIEPYLNARELVHATEVGNAAAISRLVTEIRNYEPRYEERNELWADRSMDPASRQLFDATSGSARKVFGLLRERLIPAAERHDKDAARRILEDDVAPAFDDHHLQADRFVAHVRHANADRERLAGRTARWANAAIFGGFGLVLIVIVLAALMIDRVVLAPVTAMSGHFADISQGRYDSVIELDRPDEIGDVMRALHAMRRSLQDAQTSLQRSEERFALALAGTSDGIWDLDLTSNACYYSPRWKQMLGYGEEELGADLAVFLQLLHPGDKERVVSAFDDYVSGKAQSFHVALRLRHKDAHYVDVVARARSASGASGRPTRLVGAMTDVTAETAAQRRLVLQYGATKLFADAGEIAAVAPKLLELACTTLNWDLGSVRRLNADTERGECLAVWQSPAFGPSEVPAEWRNASLVRGEGPCGEAWATGDARWVVDAAHSVEFSGTCLLQGMHTLCVIPMKLHGHVSIILELVSREIRERDDELLEVFGSLSMQLAAAVERHSAQQDLQRAERKYRDLVEQSVSGIYRATPDGRILSVNLAFARMAGYGSVAAFMAAGLNAVAFYVEPERRAAFVRLISEQGEALGFEARVRRKDGSIGWMSIYAHVVKDDNGRIVAIDGAVQDVTERKEAEQMKSDFVSFVTHQLRTPLSGIKWLLELADAPDVPAEAASYVQDARASADRLIQLVNDLLDVSRLESGKVAVHAEPVDLAVLTSEAVRELMPIANEKHQQVALPSATDIPMAEADRQLSKEVILNLLSNAVRYTPDGGTIRIEWRRADGLIEWAVHDTGIGVPAAGQHRLFEKFYRADNASTAHTEGTGLGLYIVRLIVERSGGKVWCESQEGVGSTFRFTLPAAA